MDKIYLGKQIREQRQLKKIKQDKFSEMVGISPVYLSDIERGRKSPSMETFIKIVNTLGVSSDIILKNELHAGKPHFLNEITEKLKDLPIAQLRLITDLINAVLQNYNNPIDDEED